MKSCLPRRSGGTSTLGSTFYYRKLGRGSYGEPTQKQPSRLANGLATLRLSARLVRCPSHASPANGSRGNPDSRLRILTQVNRPTHRRRICPHGKNFRKRGYSRSPRCELFTSRSVLEPAECLGSLADILTSPRHVRYSPQSRHSLAQFAHPLCAKSGQRTLAAMGGRRAATIS